MRASFRGICCVPQVRDSWIHHFCIVGRKTAGVNVKIGKKQKKMEQDNLIKNQNLFPRTTDIPQTVLKEFDRTIKYITDTLAAHKDLDRISSWFTIEEGIIGQIRRASLRTSLGGLLRCFSERRH